MSANPHPRGGTAWLVFEVRALVSDVEALTRTVESLESERTALRKRLAKMHRRAQRAEAALHRLQVERMPEKVKALLASGAEMQRENAALRARCRTAEAER